MTLTEIKNELAQKAIWTFVYNNGTAVVGAFHPYKVSPEYLCKDGRTRKKFWKELIAGGYITENTEGEFVFTEKAFNELPAQAVDLTKDYRYDAWDAKKGIGDYVSWDRLTDGQKKTVIQAIQADPTSYQLMMVNWHPVEKVCFVLGNNPHRTGNHDATLVVTNKAVQELHAKHKRDDYKTECLNGGLNWFLHEIKAIDPEQTVPVCEKQPFFGMGSAVQRDPKEWSASLPSTIEATKKEIQEARLRLETLQRWERAVEAVGGWEAFLAQYDAAVEGYVEANPAG